MKIAICTDLFYPRLEGGGEVHTYNVAKQLVRLGHDVTVLCAKTSYFSQETDHLLEDEEVVDGIQIMRGRRAYRYGSTFGSLPALTDLYNRLAHMVSNGEVDVVNFTLYRPWLPSYFAARNRIPCLPTIHLTSEGFGNYRGWVHYDGGIIGGIAQRAIESVILRVKYPLVLTVSDTQRRLLSRFLARERIRVVYNGVDLATYDSVESEGKNPTQLVYIGWLKRRKNVLDAIKAVELARKHVHDLRLLIISGGGEHEPLVRRACQQREYIQYHKKIADVQKIKLLKESSLLLFPTLKEGFSLVPLEGLACRTPFLAYDIPAMRELYELTKGGKLVQSFHVQQLANGIVELLRNRSRLLEMGESGRKRVEDYMTWEAVARREAQAFKDAMDAYA